MLENPYYDREFQWQCSSSKNCQKRQKTGLSNTTCDCIATLFIISHILYSTSLGVRHHMNLFIFIHWLIFLYKHSLYVHRQNNNWVHPKVSISFSLLSFKVSLSLQPVLSYYYCFCLQLPLSSQLYYSSFFVTFVIMTLSFPFCAHLTYISYKLHLCLSV